MTSGVDAEFMSVDLLLTSGAATRGVDAFALSLIKVEKQVRRLITFLIYQHGWCDRSVVPSLRKALEERRVYFKGLLAGWDALYPDPVAQLIGPDYAALRARLDEATKYRNKIFHGQLTSRGLQLHDFESLISDMRIWSGKLGTAADLAVGYDGCRRNSFTKAPDPGLLTSRYLVPIVDLADYRSFIRKYME